MAFESIVHPYLGESEINKNTRFTELWKEEGNMLILGVLAEWTYAMFTYARMALIRVKVALPHSKLNASSLYYLTEEGEGGCAFCSAPLNYAQVKLGCQVYLTQ